MNINYVIVDVGLYIYIYRVPNPIGFGTRFCIPRRIAMYALLKQWHC